MKKDTKAILSYTLMIVGFIYLVYLTFSILASNFWQLLIALALIIGGYFLKQ